MLGQNKPRFCRTFIAEATAFGYFVARNGSGNQFSLIGQGLEQGYVRLGAQVFRLVQFNPKLGRSFNILNLLPELFNQHLQVN